GLAPRAPGAPRAPPAAVRRAVDLAGQRRAIRGALRTIQYACTRAAAGRPPADEWGMPMALSQPQPTSHIVRNPLVLGGEATVAGTRVRVRSTVVAWQLHPDVDRVCRAYPMLGRADVAEALAFYGRHRAEIDRYIRENEDDDPDP